MSTNKSSIKQTINRPVSRRKALELGGLAAVGAASFAVAPPAKAAGTVIAGSWGGPYTEAQQAAYLDPFEAATGIKVELVIAGNFNAAGIKAFVETGYYEWDWTTLGSAQYAIAAKNGWLEPIDYGLIDKSNKSADTQFFEFGIGAESVSDVIAYRTDVFPNGGPQSWADYWDTDKFPGPRGMRKSVYPVLEAALLADGADPKNLYPLDLDRAFKKADEIKDKVTVWWESGTQSQDIITSKNVVINGMWNGRAGMLARDGAPVAITWNEGIYDPAFYVVPKGSPNKENAMRLIDFAASPQPGATFAELTYYGPTNLASIELIDAKPRKLMNTAPENLAQQVHRDYEWWADNFGTINERFIGWLVS